MAGDYLAKTDDGKAMQMILTRDNIGGFLAQMGLVATDPLVLQQAADATYFRALLDVQGTSQQFGLSWTGWKNYVRDGGAFAVATPALPVLPVTFPGTAPAPGIVPRYRFFVNYVKGRPGYTVAIGQALGIEAAHQAGPDMSTVQPVFGLTIIGNQILVGWGWQGFAAFLGSCEIQVDRGTGFGFLTIDTTPGYTDTQPFPATPTKWTYRAIYRVGDSQVGVWSNPVSIIVGG